MLWMRIDEKKSLEGGGGFAGNRQVTSHYLPRYTLPHGEENNTKETVSPDNLYSGRMIDYK